MILKRFFHNLNFLAQCREYSVPLWQCPQFLFLIMGIFIVLTSSLSYLVGARFVEDPGIVALIDLIVTAILFIIAVIINKSFERLTEASRMKSEFINIVSHQLRSPLTNLKWGIEFLTSDEFRMPNEKKEEYYSSLKENTARMVELVDDLLVVSRIEKGTLPIRREKFNLGNMIKDLIGRFELMAEASNIKIEFHSDKDVPEIYNDPSQIKIVVENLIDNAIRYIQGKGYIDIWLKRKNKQVLFEIKDSGIGIPKSDQKHIFEKFFRARNISKKDTRGSGLGLYVCKSIIKKAGGKIWFESKLGKGATFYFTLPIK